MRKLILGLLILTATTSCKKETTVWQTDWSAPVLNDTLSLVNLVNDSTLQESSGVYELDLHRTLFDLDISDVVEIPDTTIHQEFDNGGFINFPISPGYEFITSAEEHELKLDDLQLKFVTLKQGMIDITVKNPMETIAFLTVKLPGTSKNGVDFEELYEVPAASGGSPGIVSKTVDVSGYGIDLTGLSGTEHNRFTAQISGISDPDGPNVNFANADLVIVDATFRDVEIDYAKGYFGNRILSDTTEVDLDVLDVYESGVLDLSATSIKFEVENGIKVGAEATIHTIKNTNVGGNTVSLSGGQLGNAITMAPATGTMSTLTPSVQTIEFNSANSNIESYLENLGSKHKIGYSMQLNPWGNSSGGWDELFPNSRLRINVHAQMPLAIGMDDLILKDTFDLELNQNPEKTRVLSGELILKTRNAFPYAANVAIHLMDANGNVLHTVYASEPIESAQYGTFDATHNFNIADSEVKFALTEEVISDVNQVKKIVVKSTFNSINPATDLPEQMFIPAGAFLSVKLHTKFKTENVF